MCHLIDTYAFLSEKLIVEISATIDADDNFELMIRNAWRMAGGEVQC